MIFLPIPTPCWSRIPLWDGVELFLLVCSRAFCLCKTGSVVDLSGLPEDVVAVGVAVDFRAVCLTRILTVNLIQNVLNLIFYLRSQQLNELSKERAREAR